MTEFKLVVCKIGFHFIFKIILSIFRGR